MSTIVTNQEEPDARKWSNVTALDPSSVDARGWSNVTALEPVANVLAAARERATALANTEGANR